jgi:hypothetical protein
MFDLSLHTANWVFGASNVFIILGAIFGITGTIGAIWSTGIRERYADERISNNESQTALANENAAKANEHAARANEDAAKAALETEKIKSQMAWRTVTQQQADAIRNRVAVTSGTITLAYTDDPESRYFAIQLTRIFAAAKWNANAESRNYGGVAFLGICILKPITPKAQLVADTLTAVGIGYAVVDPPPSYTAQNARMGPTDVVVMVGSKPPPL